MKTLFVTNIRPKFCVECGKKQQWDDNHIVYDYDCRCAFTCSCGASFQLVDDSEIFEIAEDLKNYWGADR